MNREKRYLEELVDRYPRLNVCMEEIWNAFEIIKNAYEKGGKVLVCGNGGSCADSGHIVGELMKGFTLKRDIPNDLKEILNERFPEDAKGLSEKLECGLPAIDLSVHGALNTAFSNDKDATYIFAQEVMGFGKPEDVFIGISTSGKSRNVVLAAEIANAKGIKTIGLTGKDGGKLRDIVDVSIIVPEKETYKIQELHLPVYHTLCLMIEEYFFG